MEEHQEDKVKYSLKYSFSLDKKRLYILGVFLLIVWSSLLVLFYLKADEITKDPCTICAKRMGEDVYCTLGLLTRIYYINGTIFEDREEVIGEILDKAHERQINITNEFLLNLTPSNKDAGGGK